MWRNASSVIAAKAAILETQAGSRYATAMHLPRHCGEGRNPGESGLQPGHPLVYCLGRWRHPGTRQCSVLDCGLRRNDDRGGRRERAGLQASVGSRGSGNDGGGVCRWRYPGNAGQEQVRHCNAPPPSLRRRPQSWKRRPGAGTPLQCTSPVIAAKAAIQESQGFNLDTHWYTAWDDGAILGPGNAPSWIAASAAMTTGVVGGSGPYCRPA